MPILTQIIEEASLIIATLEGSVSGAEWAAWRNGLRAERDISRYHRIYDTLSYQGTITDPDIVAAVRPAPEAPTDRHTIIVTRDPMMALWMASLRARAGRAMPGRQVSIAESLEDALHQLGIRPPAA